MATHFKLSWILVLSLLEIACTSAPKHGQEAGQSYGPPAPVAEITGPPEAMGPPTIPTEPSYGPEPVQLKSVTLVLGPGMARSFAFAGAIRALSEAKIPIGIIVGTELGGLIAALYALDGSVNRFEWRLLKFPSELFDHHPTPFPSLFGTRDNGTKIEGALAKIFGHRDLKDSKIPLKLAVENTQTGNVSLLDHGETVKALRATVASPETFSPVDLDGAKSWSSGARMPFPVTQARTVSSGPVIVLDVLSEKAVAKGASPDETEVSKTMFKMVDAGANELKDADLVIRPDMSGIGYLDYSKRTDAAFRGKTAIAEQIKAIRQLVGLSVSGGTQ